MIFEMNRQANKLEDKVCFFLTMSSCPGQHTGLSELLALLSGTTDCTASERPAIHQRTCRPLLLKTTPGSGSMLIIPDLSLYSVIV